MSVLASIDFQGSKSLRVNDAKKLITGQQIRAARALLNWSAQELSAACKVSLATIRRAEGVDGPPSMTAANAAAVQSALEAAGVIFVSENGEGAGVRVRKAREVEG